MTILPYRTDDQRSAARPVLARHLAAGGIISYPTETVYGMGCGLLRDALERLAEWKRREARPFLLLVRDVRDAPGLRWTPEARKLADRFWPGPLTLALEAESADWPSQVVGPDGAVAVRVSPHPAVAAILEAAGGPVTSTSANRAGQVPARDAAEAERAAAGLSDLLVLDGGRLPDTVPSTIVRCGDRVRVLREGAVPVAEIESLVELE